MQFQNDYEMSSFSTMPSLYVSLNPIISWWVIKQVEGLFQIIYLYPMQFQEVTWGGLQ